MHRRLHWRELCRILVQPHKHHPYTIQMIYIDTWKVMSIISHRRHHMATGQKCNLRARSMINFTIRVLWVWQLFPVPCIAIVMTHFVGEEEIVFLSLSMRVSDFLTNPFSTSIFALKITQPTHVEKWYIPMIPFMSLRSDIFGCPKGWFEAKKNRSFSVKCK